MFCDWLILHTRSVHVHMYVTTEMVGRCLAIKVFSRQIAGYVMVVDDHRVG